MAVPTDLEEEPLLVINIFHVSEAPAVIYVDVDDTFVRSYGTKRIPIPTVIRHIWNLHRQGDTLYCWSSGGADYARASAEEFGIADCFTAFLPKPDVLLDDQNVADWRYLRQVHPNECDTLLREPDREV